MLNHNYKILTNNSLIIEYYSGDLDLQSLIKHKQNLTADTDFSPHLNYFIHLKNVLFITPPEAVSEYVNFLSDNESIFGNRKIALITNTPNQVVTTTLFKLMQSSSSNTVEIFSTNEKALEWLNCNVKYNKLAKILEELKHF